MPDTALRASTPGIAIDGRDDSSLATGLLELQVVETVQGLSRCEARFGNWGPRENRIGFLYFDRRTLDFGKTFAVKLGTDLLFEGRITALEASFPEGRPPEFTVLAEDRLQDLRMTRRTRAFADTSDSDIMNQVAGDHGLRTDIDVQGPAHKVVAQVNQSDLAFLRERARAIDAEVWVEGTTLLAKSRASRNGGTLEIGYGRQLREFTVLADLAGQRTAVSVNGWDVAAKSGVAFEAAASAIGAELNGDSSGPAILDSAFGQRKEAIAHAVPFNSEEAQAAAEAFFRTSARRFVTARGVAEADAALRVGSFIEVSGVGPLFSGRYYVAGRRVLFDLSSGIRMEFTAERPGIGQP
jgi:uncharacterized protein